MRKVCVFVVGYMTLYARFIQSNSVALSKFITVLFFLLFFVLFSMPILKHLARQPVFADNHLASCEFLSGMKCIVLKIRSD